MGSAPTWTEPRGRVAAAAMFVVITVLTAAGLTFSVLAGEPLWPNGVSALLLLAFPIVGLLIARRRPRNPVAWLCLTVGVLWASEGAGWGVALYGFARAETAVWPAILAVVSDAFVMPGLFLTATLLLLVFPDGTLPSPRWRWLAWLTVIAITATYVLALFVPTTSGWERPTVDNPLASSRIVALDLIVAPLLLACVIASVFALVRRYRRSVGIERLQLKWLAASGSGAGVMWALAILVAEPLAGEDVAVAVTVAGFALIPIAIGVAVLRYRLYEIDRLVSRTVTYGLVTVMLIGVYAGSTLALGTVMRLVTGQRSSDLVVAASTLTVAALFNPLRHRAQRLVDRRFYRSRYDVGRTVDAFSARLRENIDLDEMQADLTRVVTDTLQPGVIGLWLPGHRRTDGQPASG